MDLDPKEMGTNSHQYVLTLSTKEKHDVDCAHPLEDKLKQITRPYHPHPLKLVYEGPIVTCKLCHETCNYAFYTCANGCDFAVDVECSSIKSIILFDGHHHPLVFCEKVSKSSCYLCENSSNSSLGFQCLQCDIEIHLKCGPIPCSVKSRHMHALDLCDTYVEDDIGEDSCDICEKRRDPGQAVYLCHFCKDRSCVYVAEIDCVMSEVVKALKGDLGVVELRTVTTLLPGKVITELGNLEEDDPEKVTVNVRTQAEEAINDDADDLDDLRNSLTEVEENKLRALSEEVMSLREIKYEKLSDVIQYSDEAFKQFMESLDYNLDDDNTTEPFDMMMLWGDGDLKLVKVAGGYKIPQLFLSIYKGLVNKYDDVSKDCKFSPVGKSLLFVLLLMRTFIMCSKRVSRVSMGDLQQYHVILKYLNLAGFRIQFAIDNLNKLARAYFGRYLIKLGQDRLENLNQQIKWHSKEIKDQEARLQQVQAERGEYKRHMGAKKTRLMDKCWSEGRALKYKVGWEHML